jgi:nitroreductase
MIKDSEVRKADRQIEPLLLDRWSPRAMSGEQISHEDLMRLFEAARWAPSSFKRSTVARALRASRHGALADIFQSARRRKSATWSSS